MAEEPKKKKYDWHPKDFITIVIALVALIATSISSIASWRSSDAASKSAEAANKSLTFQQTPILVARCGLPRRERADYIVPLTSASGDGTFAFTPTDGGFPRDRFHDYAECDFENFGQYPIFRVRPSFSISYAKAKPDGSSIGFAEPSQKLSGEIDAIEPRETKVVWLINEEPCLVATATLEPTASALVIQADANATITFIGWIREYIGLRPFGAVIKAYSKGKDHLMSGTCK